MCNCGQKRMSLKTNENSAYKNSVKVRLTANKPVVINGNVTGRTYIFGRKGDINNVDKRDLDQFASYKYLMRI